MQAVRLLLLSLRDVNISKNEQQAKYLSPGTEIITGKGTCLVVILRQLHYTSQAVLEPTILPPQPSQC